MNADAAPSMLQALSILAPVIGTGGLAAIVVAFFGYLAQRNAKPSVSSASVAAIGHALQEHAAMDRMCEAIESLTRALHRHTDMAMLAGGKGQPGVADETSRELRDLIAELRRRPTK